MPRDVIIYDFGPRNTEEEAKAIARMFECSDCSDCSIGYGGRLVYLKGYRNGTDAERVELLKEALEKVSGFKFQVSS